MHPPRRQKIRRAGNLGHLAPFWWAPQSRKVLIFSLIYIKLRRFICDSFPFDSTPDSAGAPAKNCRVLEPFGGRPARARPSWQRGPGLVGAPGAGRHGPRRAGCSGGWHGPSGRQRPRPPGPGGLRGPGACGGDGLGKARPSGLVGGTAPQAATRHGPLAPRSRLTRGRGSLHL